MTETTQVIANRRTAKMLAPPTSPLKVTENLPRKRMDEWVAAAGNAPFHKPADSSHHNFNADGNTVREPWRVTKLDAKACRNLMTHLIDNELDASKVLDMLAAADGLMLVNWLPCSPENELHEGCDFEGTFENMEHLAAVGAFAQSLLLAGEADGWRTYWSSGGILRRQEVFEHLKIDRNQILLGALFFFPQQSGDAIVKPGSLSNKRSNLEAWSRWV